MVKLYNKLKIIAESEYKDIVASTKIFGKRTIGSAKLRILFKDQTYLDIWLSSSGKYSYHWEQRARRGIIYRHDNAPDFPHLKTHPQHLHDGDEKNIQPSYINTQPAIAIIHSVVKISASSWVDVIRHCEESFDYVQDDEAISII